ncbi:ABC transporter permease [uncultured Clostridium sp.]|uniref:ABC transporter permease n=1 Tax=uncultured Clostridium sp. TaxID=59620 RepID=UPI0028E9F354|nr:ABC transporter permease [uncultured Clostridium sp.]
MKKAIEVELIKLRHSKLLWIITLVPIFFVSIGFINFLRYKDIFTSKGQDVWQQLYTQSAIFYGMILLPIFVTVVMAILARIENAQDNWKKICALPVKRAHMYVSKLIIGSGFILLNLLVFMATVIVGGFFIAGNKAMPPNIMYAPLLTFISLIPVMVIQFYLSIRFSNIGVPLGVGVAFSIPSLLISNTKFWILFPWTYPGRALLNGSSINFFDMGIHMYIIGIIIATIFIVIGINEFNNRDIV